MGRCGCGDGTCQCSITTAASYLTITGSGSASDPFTLAQGTMPSVKAAKTGTQSISTATDTAVTYTATDEWDTNTFHDTSTNPSRLTVPSGFAGKYRIWGTAGIAGLASGKVRCTVRKNGTTTLARQEQDAGAGYDTYFSIYAEDDLVATDYVELVMRQESGGSDAIEADSSFGMTRFSL